MLHDGLSLSCRGSRAFSCGTAQHSAGAHLPAEIPHLELHIVVGDLLYVAAPDQTPSGCGAAGASSGVSRAGSPPNRGLCHDNLSKMQVVEDRGLARVAEADDDDLAAASRHRQLRPCRWSCRPSTTETLKAACWEGRTLKLSSAAKRPSHSFEKAKPMHAQLSQAGSASSASPAYTGRGGVWVGP